SIYNAATPIMTLLLTPLMLRSERLHRFQVIGVVMGILGVFLLTGPWRFIFSDQGHLAANLACVGAPVSYAFAVLYLRRSVASLPYDSTTLSAVQVVTASMIVLLIAPLNATTPIRLTLTVALGMLVLGA